MIGVCLLYIYERVHTRNKDDGDDDDDQSDADNTLASKQFPFKLDSTERSRV